MMKKTAGNITSTGPSKPINPEKDMPNKPNPNPDPTKPNPGNEPQRVDPTRIEEPKRNDPTRIQEPPTTPQPPEPQHITIKGFSLE